jgi:type I restriction enzyme S subunit
MMTSFTKKMLLSHAKEAVGQASLNQGQIRSLPLPLPPLKEQKRIVTKVSELIFLCDNLKDNLKDIQVTQVMLADTIITG